MRISDWSSDVCSSDLIRGCVPKKLLSYAAHFHEDFEDAAGFGWTVEGARFDWATLIANKDKEIDRLEGIYEKLLANAGRSEEHTSELQSLMSISYAVFCLQNKIRDIVFHIQLKHNN